MAHLVHAYLIELRLLLKVLVLLRHLALSLYIHILLLYHLLILKHAWLELRALVLLNIILEEIIRSLREECSF